MRVIIRRGAELINAETTGRVHLVHRALKTVLDLDPALDLALS